MSTSSKEIDKQNKIDIMNVSAIKQKDPCAEKILGSASQVALYGYMESSKEWDSLDLKGTLFVYKRCEKPWFGMIILNTQTPRDLLVYFVGDMEFQMNYPFLLYRVHKTPTDSEINGIWFYDRTELYKIGDLVSSLMEEVSPGRNSMGKQLSIKEIVVDKRPSNATKSGRNHGRRRNSYLSETNHSKQKARNMVQQQAAVTMPMPLLPMPMPSMPVPLLPMPSMHVPLLPMPSMPVPLLPMPSMPVSLLPMPVQRSDHNNGGSGVGGGGGEVDILALLEKAHQEYKVKNSVNSTVSIYNEDLQPNYTPEQQMSDQIRHRERVNSINSETMLIRSRVNSLNSSNNSFPGRDFNELRILDTNTSERVRNVDRLQFMSPPFPTSTLLLTPDEFSNNPIVDRGGAGGAVGMSMNYNQPMTYDLLPPANYREEPATHDSTSLILNRQQFRDTILNLIQEDTEFVDKLHMLYIDKLAAGTSGGQRN